MKLPNVFKRKWISCPTPVRIDRVGPQVKLHIPRGESPIGVQIDFWGRLQERVSPTSWAKKNLRTTRRL
jgi:hypothetical protein